MYLCIRDHNAGNTVKIEDDWDISSKRDTTEANDKQIDGVSISLHGRVYRRFDLY